MLIPVEKDSNIFNTKPFILDEVSFNLIHRIRDDENATILKSDDGKIIIAQSSDQYPAWVWTDKSLEQQKYKEVTEDFYKLFSDRTMLKFVAKPQIAKFLANEYAKQRNIKWKISMSLEAYQCPQIIYPANVKGSIRKPTLEDINVISDFCKSFIKECFGIEKSIDKQIKLAKSYILSDNFYVWQNGNKVVSMANIAHKSTRHERINEVYTAPIHRKKGYASALVSKMSKIIQRENKTPVLYTDLSNPASNKAYKKIGFIECGRVDQISFEF